MTTEGTYPYVSGGVSTWCAQLISGLDELRWQVLPITAGSHGGGAPLFRLPGSATLLDRVELWSEQPPPRRRRGATAELRLSLPAELVRDLLGWNGSPSGLEDALVYCRQAAHRLRTIFRCSDAWRGFLAELHDVLDERPPGVGPSPIIDLHHAAVLYQALYWVARVAAVPTPPTDLLLVSAAGWAAIPAIVHRAEQGTPLLLVEHGVYVREAYLIALRLDGSPAARFINTRLARGLARAAYAVADCVCPVSEANACWEEALGVFPGRITVIRNSVAAPAEPALLPGNSVVINIGRIDPLKDVPTLLEVAAEVVRHVPEARFVQYGSVSPGQDAYYRSCLKLHDDLGLGERFQFMGHTSDPVGVLRDADIVIMTSISEGFPMSLLEAMSQGRSIVSTWVGGVPEAVGGCGILAPPGDVQGLSMGVVTLLRDGTLARTLGRRGYERVCNQFSEAVWLRQYRELLHGLAATGGGAAQ